MTFSESGLRFTFPADWGVRQYDDHRFYQAMSGRGLKAVDFVILPAAGGVWFVEVKNYTRRPGRYHESNTIELPDPEDLATTLLEKYTDSRRALLAIATYYRRKWWYRRLNRLLRLFSRRYRRDSTFWTEAQDRLDREPPRVILLVSTGPDENGFMHRLRDAVDTRTAAEQAAFSVGAPEEYFTRFIGG